MTSWFHETPAILLALTLLVAPGLLLAVCLRFRWWDAAALSVPLSLGVLAAADELSIKGKIGWGLPVVGLATVISAVVCLAFTWVRGRFGSRRQHEAAVASIDVWSRVHHYVAAVVTLGAAVVGAVAVARGIGTPSTINQTFDGVFHVNSINVVAHLHSAAPGLFTNLTNPHAGHGFYPPTFGALGGLLVMATGISPIVAANVLAVVIAVLWPVSVSIAVRRLARPSVFGYSIAMVGAVTIGLFPALLLRFGTLWPNALSYLALPGALVILVRLLGLDRSDDDAPDPHGRLDWWASAFVAIIALVGLVFSHPGVIFLAFYLAVPAVIWFGWRRFNVRMSPPRTSQITRGAAIVVAVLVVFVGLVLVADQTSTVTSMRHQYWPPTVTWYGAIGEILTLASYLSYANAAMAALVLVGVYTALKTGIGRYVVTGYAVLAVLTVFCASVQSSVTMRFTDFWFNDPNRLFAALPALALPLVALGADQMKTLVARAATWVAERGGARRRFVASPVVSVVVICAAIIGLQAGFGTGQITHTVAQSYGQAYHVIVNDAEAAMFKRLAHEVPEGQSIAGDPFTGEVLAGILSGRTSAYPSFSSPKGADQQLVALSFSSYRTDPAACAAVKRLKIAVVIGGPHFFEENHKLFRAFRGFRNVATVPGLTLIDSGGGAEAFRVGPCTG